MKVSIKTGKYNTIIFNRFAKKGAGIFEELKGSENLFALSSSELYHTFSVQIGDTSLIRKKLTYFTKSLDYFISVGSFNAEILFFFL